MDGSNTQDRNLIPRWRSLSRTPLRELESAQARKVSKAADEEDKVFRLFYDRWQEASTFENALEVVDRAVCIERPYLAMGPAKQIAEAKFATPALRDLALYVINGPQHRNLDDQPRLEGREVVSAKIRTTKRLLDLNPRDGLLWLEKGRLHTLVGEFRNADLSLQRAWGCASGNRVVVRAYARYLTHRNRADEALFKLRRLSSLRYDPWIQAAEIAVAEASSEPPMSVKFGRGSLSSSNFDAFHLSELAASLGTLELKNGALKKARRLFNQSLSCPTDNSLSQALWIRDERHLSINVNGDMLAIPGAFEARAQSALQQGDWVEAVRNCEKWVQDEPFSLRAVIEGAYVAGNLLWDHAKAVEFCDIGLIANPDHKVLLNNKALSLARGGRVDEAKTVLESAHRRSSSHQDDPFLIATSGLVAFRSDDIPEGRRLYSLAVEKAAAIKNTDAHFRAYCHWFYEEARANSLSQSTISEITKVIDQRSKDAGIRSVSKELWSKLSTRITERSFGENISSDSGQFPIIFDGPKAVGLIS